MFDRKRYMKEYYRKNRKKLQEYGINYYKQNKKRMKKLHKKYREKNKEHLKIYYKNNTEYFKAYYKNNKDKIRESRKINRLNNPKKFREWRREYERIHKKELNARQIARYHYNSMKKIKNCMVCGSNENIELHHQNYDKPLEVIFLCHNCHWDVRRVL